MNGPIVIDEVIAKRDGIDIPALIAWYKKTRGITVVTGDVKLTANDIRTCRKCRVKRYSKEYRRVTSAGGGLGRLSRVCLFCEEEKATAKAEMKLTCETCSAAFPSADFRDRHGVMRRSCAACRGMCFKPPYGWTTCPGCGERRHRDEFRMTRSGKPKPGRPYETCDTCRA